MTYKATFGKTEVAIYQVTGKRTYYVIQVKSATAKTWKSIGKEFETLEHAKCHYKSINMRTIIDQAEAAFAN
jgi:hypothetical protein